MEYFVNDYSKICHPRILDRMRDHLTDPQAGYGYDIHCDRAKELLYKEMGRSDGDIHFIPGGTQANLVAIAAFLRPHQAVIGARTAHIHDHEAGAIESRGHKIYLADSSDGKLRPEAIDHLVQSHQAENTAHLKLVYISNTTEVGTVYTKKEIKALYDYCVSQDLILYIDGARLGSALTSPVNDMSLADFAKYSHAFFIGGTKNGAMIGEALVIMKDELKEDFRVIMKQNGAILAKSFVTGIQFEVLFEDGLYYDLADHANKLAMKLAGALREKGYDLIQEAQSNQIFPIFTKEKIRELRENFAFEDWAEEGEGLYSVRFVTSWATKESSVDALIRAL
ncbi:low specificity L-threonine aldolase [Kallipyga massiliensis]|uniref:threonine aldolase family protein n=1 Tax=Kallipyga massiliensis TaxID=1472764 RepID=UPI0026EC40CE|nr:aminotransferase class I/II-fold pyridoxal phosphate-dependent enzyme [Kallipyga massiliensis]